MIFAEEYKSFAVYKQRGTQPLCCHIVSLCVISILVTSLKHNAVYNIILSAVNAQCISSEQHCQVSIM